MSETINARLHGGNREGRIVKFKIVDALTARTDTQELARVCGVSVDRAEADPAHTLRGRTQA